MQLQKEVKFISKQPSCKKSERPPKRCCCEKRCKIQGGGQEMAVMIRSSIAKILIMTIQVNLCAFLYVLLGLGTKFI